MDYSLRESVSAQGREGRGFDSDPGRKKKGYILSRDSEVKALYQYRKCIGENSQFLPVNNIFNLQF
jgi:hypothetical protein